MAVSKLITKPIERWLQREAPEQCATLALVYAGMTESNVAAWTRAQFDSFPVGDFALDIVNAAEDDAQGIGRECRYSLKWLDSDGSTVLAMSWRAGDGLNLNLDGTIESQLAQLQRHLEVMAKQSAQGVNTLLEHYQEALSAAQLRIKSLEEVRDAFELQRLEQIAETPITPTEDNQLDKLAKTLEGLERISTTLAKKNLLGAGDAKSDKAAS